MTKREKGDKNFSQRENTEGVVSSERLHRCDTRAFPSRREDVSRVLPNSDKYLSSFCAHVRYAYYCCQRRNEKDLPHTLNLDINPTLSRFALSLYDTFTNTVVFHMPVFIFLRKFVYLLKFEKVNLRTFSPDLF